MEERKGESGCLRETLTRRSSAARPYSCRDHSRIDMVTHFDGYHRQAMLPFSYGTRQLIATEVRVGLCRMRGSLQNALHGSCARLGRGAAPPPRHVRPPTDRSGADAARTARAQRTRRRGHRIGRRGRVRAGIIIARACGVRLPA